MVNERSHTHENETVTKRAHTILKLKIQMAKNLTQVGNTEFQMQICFRWERRA